MAMAMAMAMEDPSREFCDYVDVDEKSRKATYLRVPRLEDVPYAAQMEPQLVVEFYSR